MKQQSAFEITPFTNPSGDIVFRVTGWLDGERVRKNFKTRAEARAEVQTLEIKQVQDDARVRTAITRLSDDELHEAETAYRWLKDKPKSLLFYLEFAFANYRAPENDMALAFGIDDYVAAKQRECDQGVITQSQVNSIKKELKRLLKACPKTSVSELTPKRLTEFCERDKPSLKTVNNRRGILGAFFKFSFQREWVAANPIEKVPRYRLGRNRSSAQTITPKQAAELMEYVETYQQGRLVPFFALCLFAGIRPCLRGGEILKLKPEDVRLDENKIVIWPKVSKVHEKREIVIQPNLAAWLRAYPLETFPIIPTNLQKTRARVAKKFALTKDVLRHTFISMFIAKFRSIGEAALQAGNSEAIIRRHYLDLKTKAEAEEFFGILPKHAPTSLRLLGAPNESRVQAA